MALDSEDKDTFSGGVVLKPEVMPVGKPAPTDEGALSRVEVKDALRRNGVKIDDLIKKGVEGLEASKRGKDEMGAEIVVPLWNTRFKYWSAFMEMFGALNVKASSVEVNTYTMSIEQRMATIDRVTKIMASRVKKNV